MTQTLSQLENRGAFIERHIGPDAAQQQEMLNAVGAESLNALTGQIVPKDIQLATPPQVGEAATEYAALAELKPSPGVTSASRRTLAWATPPCSYRRLSCATCWKIQAGTPPTLLISRKSLRGVWKRCSTSNR
ncbi:glycine dehydrogenase [Salmonella enterica subsp. enterica serovar Choleraesuis str. 0006]|nr:glycine dehydrogenase [Salmonella enterica subsp. enterica serovar Choleraesuis str. 0006]